MTLSRVFDVLWRHKWLMLAIVFVTMLAVPLRLMTNEGEYSGTVKLLVTVPERTNVEVFGSYRASTVEDEINIARNNFVDVLDSDETRRRVITALNLPEPLHNYKLAVHVSRETDFLSVQVTTVDAQWAAQIANEHVAQARQYFGEIRAQPAANAKLALAAQISGAATQLAEAEQSLVQFKNENRITSIEAEQELRLAVLQRLYDQRHDAELAASGAGLAGAFPDLIESLDSMRSASVARDDRQKAAALDEVISVASGQIRAYLDDSAGLGPADRLANIIAELEAHRVGAEQVGRFAVAESYAYVIAYYSGQLLEIKQANTSLQVIDELIATQEAKVSELNELAPQYTEFVVRAQQARSNYETLSDAYQEAVIKEDTALRSDFIQVVLPAAVESRTDRSGALTLIVLGLVASLGAAITLAFVAELLGRWLWPAEPVVNTSKALERRHS